MRFIFKRNKHKHTWQLVDVAWMEYVFFGGDVTLVLYHCTECDQRTTERVEGHWTKKQLEGKHL